MVNSCYKSLLYLKEYSMYTKKFSFSVYCFIAAMAFVIMPCSYALAQVPAKFQNPKPTEKASVSEESEESSEDFGDDSLAYDEAKSYEESKSLEAASSDSNSEYSGDEPYTISDVHIDLKSLPVSKARDQALIQAQRLAYRSLCQRFAVQDNADKLSDDDIANIVKSFEMQKEQISAARYIGVFRISFKPEAAKKYIFDSKNTSSVSAFREDAFKNGFQNSETFPPPKEQSLDRIPYYLQTSQTMESNAAPHSALFTINAEITASSSDAWTRIKSKISSIPEVTDIKIEGLDNGLVKIKLSFNTSIQNLAQRLSAQSLLLRQISYDVYEIYEMG